MSTTPNAPAPATAPVVKPNTIVLVIGSGASAFRFNTGVPLTQERLNETFKWAASLARKIGKDSAWLANRQYPTTGTVKIEKAKITVPAFHLEGLIGATGKSAVLPGYGKAEDNSATTTLSYSASDENGIAFNVDAFIAEQTKPSE